MASVPEFIAIIKEKNQRLEDIPAKFLSRVKRAEKQVYEKIIELLSTLETKNGQFVASRRNIEIAGRINESLKQVLIESEYTRAVSQFAKEFDIQADVNFRYFAEAFSVQAAPEVMAVIVNQAKRNAIDLLINRAADSEFIYPLRDIIEQSVINNAGYGDTLQAIREFVEGTDDRDSRLLRYSGQIAHDSFAVADRSVSSVYADEIDAEWFYYSGGLIETSRAFCKERAGEYYYYKEIEAWGDGLKTSGLELPDADGNWQGKILGTTAANIYSYAGGYWCGHTIMPVSIFDVPIEDIQRNMDAGYFTPSEFEKSELGL